MHTLLHKQLLFIILIATAAIGIIVGAWVLALMDGGSPSDITTYPTVNRTTETSTGEDTTASSGTQTETTTPIQTTTAAVSPVTPAGKVIAITFDDGPSSQYTEQILDILERYNAKATFFVNGYQLSSAKASMLQRAVAMGCEIGNHTDSHARLTTLSQKEIYEELQAVNNRIKELCGTEVTLMRPPGGHTDLTVMQSMYDSGLRLHTILWNNDSRDWEFCAQYKKGDITRAEAVQKTYEMIMQYPCDGAILLMHDIGEIAPDVLELVLEKLSAEGYTFVSVSELFDFDSMGSEAYFSKFYSRNNIVNLR